mmetsp:Transcript_13788/g.29448  ORF Transcript_13788/g.29448 Transcript_13788/m.29448 type:complete len:204 (-) Transcript_13788:535-1146(-)
MTQQAFKSRAKAKLDHLDGATVSTNLLDLGTIREDVHLFQILLPLMKVDHFEPMLEDTASKSRGVIIVGTSKIERLVGCSAEIHVDSHHSQRRGATTLGVQLLDALMRKIKVESGGNLRLGISVRAKGNFEDVYNVRLVCSHLVEPFARGNGFDFTILGNGKGAALNDHGLLTKNGDPWLVGVQFSRRKETHVQSNLDPLLLG